MKISILFTILFTLGGYYVTQPVDVPRKTSEHIIKVEDTYGSGTAFYLNYKNKVYLVTNNHVCGDSYGLSSIDGYHRVLKVSKKHDLCILDGRREVGLNLAKENIETFDEVHVVGFPLGQPVTHRHGTLVSEVSDIFPWISEYPIRVLHLSLNVFGGNSGSPALNKYGRVVGVVFASNLRTHEDGYAVPKLDLIKFLEEQRIDKSLILLNKLIKKE
jgi:S1-C subfamily serine protease